MGFIRKNLKKSTPEQEREFRDRMTDVAFKDKLIMIGTGYLIVLLPCALILIGLSLLVMFLFGVL